jgi:ABC-type Zn uptake system ZnuABC Zn-binding protein ZnuA
MAQNRSMRKRKRQREFHLSKENSSIEDLVRNEENEYPVPNHKRMMINITNELNDVHKEFLKEEIQNELMKYVEKLQEKDRKYKKSIQKI